MLQPNELTEGLENYFYIILTGHFAISVLLAYMLHFLLKKRFADRPEFRRRDEEDLASIEDDSLRGRIARWLFRLSFHRYNSLYAFLTLFLLAFSMPVVGYASAIWIAYYLRSVVYKKEEFSTHTLNLDEFDEIFAHTKRIFGESALLEMMNNPYIPKSKKLQALVELSQNLDPVNIKVVQETLKSEDDEVRMFGYAILNKTELSINRRINEALEELQKEDTTKEKEAYLKKRLAALYWDLVYYGFAQDVLEGEFLEMIYRYDDEAEVFFHSKIMELKDRLVHLLDNQEEDLKGYLLGELRKLYEEYIEIKVLKGKIKMRQNEHTQAIEEFTIALSIAEDELDTDLSYIYPYIAEIYYNEGRYRITREVMHQARNLEYNTKLYPLVLQWRAS